jgi:DNA-binding phage protein
MSLREKKSPRRTSVMELASETGLGSQALAFNDDNVVRLLRAAIEHEGNQAAYARRHGIERTGLNMILRGKRPVSDTVIKTLGFRKIYVPE